MSKSLERLQFLTSLRFASAKAKPKLSADENISRVLDSEIDCAERECVDRQVKLNEPSFFPFDLFLDSMTWILLKNSVFFYSFMICLVTVVDMLGCYFEIEFISLVSKVASFGIEITTIIKLIPR